MSAKKRMALVYPRTLFKEKQEAEHAKKEKELKEDAEKKEKDVKEQAKKTEEGAKEIGKAVGDQAKKAAAVKDKAKGEVIKKKAALVQAKEA